MSWKVYIVKCADDSYYTGISTDVEMRIKMHNEGKGAKYTRGRGPVILEEAKDFGDRSSALKEEYRIKQLSRKKKELVIGEWRVDRLRCEYVYDPEDNEDE